MKRKPIYVESNIQTDINKIWKYTQNPEYHQQWDLRFSDIQYLPKEHQDGPQQFLYRTNIGFGISIDGQGESIKSIEGADGQRTSSLKFWSDRMISLISEGRGYWQYTPTVQGIEFKTKYDYDTRFGVFGAVFDRLIFRPLMGWATAFSFDCLRLWIERSIHPMSLFRHALTHWLIRIIIAFVWIYQGLIPKIVYPQHGEQRLLEQTGWFTGYEEAVLLLIGVLEILFGILILCWSNRSLHAIHIIVLLGFTLASYHSDSATWLQPFNPITLNLLLLSLSVIYLMIDSVVPKASRCKREPAVSDRRHGH